MAVADERTGHIIKQWPPVLAAMAGDKVPWYRAGAMKNHISPRHELEVALLQFKSTFLTVGAFSAIINLLMLAPSLYMLQVYDRVLASANQITLAMLTLMVLGVYLVTAALELIRSFILVRVGAAFDMALNRRVYSAAF
jgi:ATP-binding cassette, subfamily C, bacterial exporter for protease/lipase